MAPFFMAHLVTPDTYDARLETCRRCHLWSAPDGRCKGCGCYMTIKARWVHAVCPLRRWPAPAAQSPAET